MPKFIKQDDLNRIKELKLRQDQNAYALGVARAEYLKQEKFYMFKINDTEQLQKISGVDALNNVGLDSEKNNFRIDENTGEILMLNAGVWESLEG